MMPIVRWWVVANPRQWSWTQLFETGHIRFQLGRLARNFPRLQVGDLIVGYESSPHRRLMALARVSKPLGVHDENAAASFELAPVCLFSHGVDYGTIQKNEILARSQPMRNRNQGTLFELSEIESQQVMELISFDDAVRGWLDAVENSHPRVESNKIYRR